MNSYWDQRLKDATLVHTPRGNRLRTSDGILHLPPIAGGDFTADVLAGVAEVKKAFDDNKGEMVRLIQAQADDIKKFGTTTDSVVEQMKTAEKRFEEIAETLKSLQAFGDRIDELDKKMSRLPFNANGDRKTIGRTFVESPEYKAFNQNGKLMGTASGIVQVKALTGLPLYTELPGYLYTPERVPGFFANPDRMDRVANLFPIVRTTLGAVEFVVETGFTNAAAFVAETGNKPPSSISFDVTSVPMATIAHYLEVTRQILADETSLEDYLNTRLITGLRLTEDAKLLYGNGTGGDILGVFEHQGIQHYSIDDDTDSNGDPQSKLDAIRRGILKARVAEYPVSGVVLNPNDWADIELLKGSDGHYLWVNVPSGGEMRVWRVPVVETTAINPGQCLTGAFQLGAAVWDREEATIRATDSHGTNFTQNIWLILAEERKALTIYRPEAFVDIDLIGES